MINQLKKTASVKKIFDKLIIWFNVKVSKDSFPGLLHQNLLFVLQKIGQLLFKSKDKTIFILTQSARLNLMIVHWTC